MISVDNAARETHVGREMARLFASIEEAEKAQQEQTERLSSVLTQEPGTISQKEPLPPKPAMVPLANQISDFADRVLRIAKRSQSVTARIEL